MQYEHVFAVSNAEAKPLATINLATAGLLERQHLQEWLIANPQILGADAMIVTSEFDRWQTALGASRHDRLDILAMDSGGQLILAELKRDAASSDVDLQALKYAALVSRFSVDTLVEAHLRFLTRKGGPVTESDARAALEAHLDGPLDSEAWAQPRIILVASSYPETVTNTVVWLSEAGLEIVLLRYQLYASAGDPLLVVTQMYPTPETEDFQLTPRREELKQVKERSEARQRQMDVVKVLVSASALTPGTPLTLTPTGVRDELKTQVLAWLEEDPTRSAATWTNEVAEPIAWAYAGERGKPSTFASRALEEATGVRRSLHGPRWWRLDDGTSLADLAAEYTISRGRDWSDLHIILENLPPGRWTTYGDLASVIGTAAQPLGLHIAKCVDCQNAHRVLKSDGRVAERFQWNDPDETQTPREFLEAEGVSFGDSDRASAETRLSADTLRRLSPDS